MFWTDPPPPPGPGVNWDYCDISGDDYTGENLRGASMIGTTADGTNFEDADLSDVVATNGIFTYADLKDGADVSNGDFSDSNLGRAMFSVIVIWTELFLMVQICLVLDFIVLQMLLMLSFDDVKFEWADRHSVWLCQ